MDTNGLDWLILGMAGLLVSSIAGLVIAPRAKSERPAVTPTPPTSEPEQAGPPAAVIDLIPQEQPMALSVTPDMVTALAAIGEQAILDSEFIHLTDGSGSAEKTQGTKGTYLRSPADGYQLRGPFDAVL